MGAITETAPGGEMVCIVGFEARPRDLDGRSIAGSRRAFFPGERVRYVKHVHVGKPEDNPLGYMAIFQPLGTSEDHFYGGVQDYFVSLDCWETLKEHFAKQGQPSPVGSARRTGV